MSAPGKTQEPGTTNSKAPSPAGLSSASNTQPRASTGKPGKIPRQCAYFASEGGCQKGDTCLYLHEMEGGRPKPATPEDVARLQARAKVSPALRPPSKPPVKATMPPTPTVKMIHADVSVGEITVFL